MSSAREEPGLSLSSERLGFTLFLSLSVHAALILGVGFGALDTLTPRSTLEITLAQYRSEAAPEEADFLGQENQSGSGTLEEKAAPSTPVLAPFQADDAPLSAARRPQAAAAPQPSPMPPQLSSSNALLQIPAVAEQQANPEQRSSEAESLSGEDLDAALASLQAQLDLQLQAYAKRPRKYTISSASTRKDRDALYLDAWRKRIESVGNQHYPVEASRAGLYGTLRLMVALRPDGRVHETRILSSSGHALLDEAALRIVQLAAPFEAFPPSMREEVDILEIVRTWQFHRGNSLSSY